MTATAARAVLATKSKSFALAARLLPATCRDDAAILYAWCRRADDAIDECDATEAPGRLLALRSELELVYHDLCPRDATLAAFQDLVRKHHIPIEHPRSLLDGFAMDLGRVRFKTTDELLLYAYRVAGVVGLMMCPLLGVRDRVALSHATDLGIAMQLTNICRDVKEDWDKGRLYLPEELLASAGLADLGNWLGQPLPEQARDGLRQVVQRLLELADDYYASGDRGVPFLPMRTALAIRTARRVYSAIGTRLRQRECDAIHGRIFVPLHDKLALAMLAVAEELASRVATGINRVLSRTSRTRGTSRCASVAHWEGLGHAAVRVHA